MAEKNQEQKKLVKVPNTYVIIVLFIIVFALLSYVIPAGVYNMVTQNGRKVVDPNSFHYVESTPVPIWRIVTSIPSGLAKQASLIFFLFLVAGSVQIISASGVVDAVLGSLIKKFKGKGIFMVPFFMICFGLISSVGINSAMVAFTPIGLMIAKSLTLDGLVGVAMVMMGTCCGWSAGAFSTATTGVAQSMIGLPFLSGMGLRIVTMVLFFAFGSYMITSYSMKISRDPTKSLCYGMETSYAGDVELPALTTRRMIGGLVFLVGFGLVLYGAVKGWKMHTDIAGVFMVTGVLCGFICGMNADTIAKEFVKGLRTMAFGGIIVGFANAISIVMGEGQIIHTIIHFFSNMMQGLPRILSAEAMYVFQIIINFFIPSGSGQAAATIPIVSPIGQLLDIPQQVVVLAYNFGDGITNQIMPQSSTTMGALGMAGIGFTLWFKYIWRWILGMILIGAVMVAAAMLINYGPF